MTEEDKSEIKNVSYVSLQQAKKLVEELNGLERVESYKEILINSIAEALDKSFMEGVQCEKAMKRFEEISDQLRKG